MPPLLQYLHAKQFEKAPSIHVVAKDQIATISAGHDVIHGTRVFQSKRARHARSVIRNAPACQVLRACIVINYRDALPTRAGGVASRWLQGIELTLRLLTLPHYAMM